MTGVKKVRELESMPHKECLTMGMTLVVLKPGELPLQGRRPGFGKHAMFY